MEASPVPPGEVKILVVEDSRTQAAQLQHQLLQQGFQVSVANNGLEALAHLRREIPTLIISDIVMPEMDGYELCRRLRETPAYRDIPVILLTALSDLEDVVLALESGADNFVTKPYKLDYLLSRIENILINRQLRRSAPSDMGIQVFFANQQHTFRSEPEKVVDLLLSTFENAVQKNLELQRANHQLLAMQQELRKKNRELARLNEQKDQLLGMAAHDLRNPLSHIVTVTDIVMEQAGERLSSDERELLGIAKTSSKFMVDLINDLLDVAKIESGKITLNLQPLDLVSLVAQNVNLNRSLAERKEISLEFHQPDVPVWVMADPHKINQVLNNLISNAVKFSHPHTRIEVRITASEDQTILAVADQGQGIPEEELGKLFQPFQRTSVRSTAGEASTGLGLAIVKKIVEAHRGNIWVESEVGRGSTFYVSLPVIQQEGEKTS
ncbi:MAG: hybrid sensor histidine kinase/response regulator [Caldilineae bacterium]|nr:MAG: hybrid sensor histidine kinase/response regulator [Caldilineae bacterium]